MVNKKKLIAYTFVAIMVLAAFAGVSSIIPDQHTSASPVQSIPNLPAISPAYTPGTIGVGTNPECLAYDPSNNYIYVANYGAGTVSVISGTNNTVISTVSVGTNPHGVAYDSSNGYIYVANSGSGTVSVISGTTVVNTISGLSAPEGVAYDASNNYIYVSTINTSLCYDPGYVAVISGTNTVISTVSVGNNPYGVAYDSSNGYIYVANDGSNSVSVISGTNNTVISTVSVGDSPDDKEYSPWGVAYDPSNNYIYVAEHNSPGAVTVISGTSVVTRISVGIYPDALAYDSLNNYIYVANSGSGTVSVISGTTVVNTISGLSAPEGVAYDSSNGYIYVANDGSNSVSYIMPIVSSNNPSDAGQKVTFLATSGSTAPYQWYVNGIAVNMTYPITLSGVPSGTGTYQQLITIKNPADYGINSNGSNIQFTAGNGTLLYAWIQNINSSQMQVWVKNYNASSIIDMQVFPASNNFFSANGYLGNNATADNGANVFPYFATNETWYASEGSIDVFPNETINPNQGILGGGITFHLTNLSNTGGDLALSLGWNSLNLLVGYTSNPATVGIDDYQSDGVYTSSSYSSTLYADSFLNFMLQQNTTNAEYGAFYANGILQQLVKQVNNASGKPIQFYTQNTTSQSYISLPYAFFTSMTMNIMPTYSIG